jgi:hypothetical protein
MRDLRRRLRTVGNLAVVLDKWSDLVLFDRFGGGISRCDGFLASLFILRLVSY